MSECEHAAFTFNTADSVLTLIPVHLLWVSLSSQLHVFVMLLTATFFVDILTLI